jgi:hypothetical protein
MDYSLAGLIGSSVALAVGLIAYLAALPSLLQWLRSVAPRDTAEQRTDLELKLGVMRRLVLTAMIVACGWGGYWLGKTVAG